ncbi:hypothetical protein OESDEN_12574 [Oesophagostomum dentatum]|uniref:Uncharacterized protein n=2 Tax=Oesophagostomum dentatum TaxID=61180 RepID=A0A0B1SVY8_OESDE|nr:hypothetical protein OESDEN_12574 [Oesophagostomum dentatum]
MSSTNDGSLIALSAENNLFIVRVSSDLWAAKSENYIPLNQYVCELEQVHPTLFESVRPPKVLQMRWILADSFNCSVHFLAVLFDDNRIRIYRAEGVCDVPAMVIDYSLFMCASDRPHETPGTNSYGLFKSIVSFDSVTSPGEDPILVAIDSEGELYATVVNVISNVQPSTRPLIPPSALPCDPVAIQAVEHPMSDVFSVFAILSTGNVISFVVAIPDEQSFYSLFLHEQLQLPRSTSLNLCATDLQYGVFVANESLILHLDLSEWIQDYVAVLQDHSSDKAQISKGSTVRELIHIQADANNEPNIPNLYGISTNRAVHLLCKSGTIRGSTTLVVGLTQNPPLAIVFLRQKLPEAVSTDNYVPSAAKLMGPPLNENVLKAIIAKKEALPRITTTASPQESLQSISNFFSVAHKNQMTLAAALEMSQDRLAEIMKFTKQLTEKQNDVNQRLLKVLRQNVALRDKKEKVRAAVAKSLARADRVLARSYDQKLSGEETKLLATLKECRARMLSYAMETSKLSLQAAELQRETRGPARPFTASAGASLFVLQTSEKDLLALKQRLDNLSAKMENSELKFGENKENIDRTRQ